MIYYHVTIKLTPYACKGYREEVVISEDPLDLDERNTTNRNQLLSAYEMISTRKITKTLYDRHRKRNPKKANLKYSFQTIALLERDYSSKEK